MNSAQHTMTTCVVDLVAARAAETPHAVAVAEGYRQLTYGELDARANQLAHLLRDRGVGPNVLVGLCMRR
jgi:non-ribosomal peptide synthetase component F